MPRTKKNFNAKQTQLINQIWSIFLKYGYQNTTLAVILKELDISKGVFYHYFDSKEQCAESAVHVYSDVLVEKLKEQCENHNFSNQTPTRKLAMLFEQGQILFAEDMDALADLNTASNKVFHEMLMVALTKKLAREYAGIITEGAENGCFQTAYPAELAEMILVLSNFYLDADFFGWEEQSVIRKAEAYKEFICRGLGIPVSHLF